MSTTRLLLNEFEYIAPASLHDALDLLSTGNDVKILAGGTDLLVKLKSGVDIPLEILLDTKNIAQELDFVARNGYELEIGSLTKLSTLEKHDTIRKYHALSDALPLMASVAVRNMGTIGGNIANASPAADTACPLIVYDATVCVSSADGDREVLIHDFFKGPGQCDLLHDEMIVSFRLPEVAPNSGSCFLKKTRVKPDISKISATAYLERDGDVISACKVALGSVAATPLCLCEIALGAVAKKASLELFEELAKKIAAAIRPIDDNRSTAEYRHALAEMLVKEALETAWERAGGIL
ncbi:MAG: xanthine dehydrogenase family protein subunit M [Clostridiales bacterium]|jgi:carbon-monoxide dehydrogenase medium subunit|nr:xanthine dehydrogenase family protein subunit M [Clostridiales bacterium]